MHSFPTAHRNPPGPSAMPSVLRPGHSKTASHSARLTRLGIARRLLVAPPQDVCVRGDQARGPQAALPLSAASIPYPSRRPTPAARLACGRSAAGSSSGRRCASARGCRQARERVAVAELPAVQVHTRERAVGENALRLSPNSAQPERESRLRAHITLPRLAQVSL